MFQRILVAACVALLCSVTMTASAGMNVVVILTDDERFDSIEQTPNIAALASRGVQFTRAYQPTPLCAPSRATMFSGGFLSQNTGLLENDGFPNGGVKLFNDRVNLGTVMQQAGYRTQFVGKWVNGYEKLGAYVPPGWSSWTGRHSFANATSWFNFKYTLGSSGATASTRGTIVSSNAYTADYERDRVLAFIGSVPRDQPFFVLWAPSAPHEIAMPAAQDTDAFGGFTYRGRGVGETDLSDKPRWVRNYHDPIDDDEFIRDQLRSLQSVDRGVDAIVDKVQARGETGNTVFIFASDNGYMWGEHGLWKKSKPYEEAARVPMIVVMPGIAPRIEKKLVSPGLDVGPTIYEIAGVTRATDGRSLLPLLNNPQTAWRTQFFLEHYASTNNGNAIFAGLVGERWKYVRYWSGEEELYDLQNDPFELRSRHADPSLEAIKASLSTGLDSRLGIAIRPVVPRFPDPIVGKAYRYAMRPWGGKGPLTWTIASGALPPGLRLDADSGVITGVPTVRGTYTVQVRVTDSVLATQARKNQTFVTRNLAMTVKPSAL